MANGAGEPWWVVWGESIATIFATCMGVLGTGLIWVFRDRSAAWQKIIENEAELSDLRASYEKHLVESERWKDDIRNHERMVAVLQSEVKSLRRRLDARRMHESEDEE